MRGTHCPSFMPWTQRLVSTFTSAPHTLVLFALPSLHLLCVHNTEKLFTVWLFSSFTALQHLGPTKSQQSSTFQNSYHWLLPLSASGQAQPAACFAGSRGQGLERWEQQEEGRRSAGSSQLELSTLVRGSQSPAGQEPLSAVTLECCQAALRISKHVPTTFCFSYLS